MQIDKQFIEIWIFEHS